MKYLNVFVYKSKSIEWKNDSIQNTHVERLTNGRIYCINRFMGEQISDTIQ